MYICESHKGYSKIYDNLSLLSFTVDIVAVTISPSGPSQPNPGDIFSLTCSAIIKDVPLPPNVPSPTFVWFVDTSSNASLPSGVSPMATIMNSTNSTNTYTSTLKFSPFSQSHAGMYTCRLGIGRLANSTNIITVNGTIV